MNKGWYYIAAEKDLLLKKESDINWKNVGLGLGAGAVGLGLLSNNLPTKEPQSPQKVNQIEQSPIAINKDIQQELPQQKIQQEKAPPTTQSSFVSDEELESFIAPWEGVKNKAYKDSKGIWTVGIGFNLESPNSDAILKQIGVDKNDLIRGKAVLNKDQISKLFKINLKTAITDAKRWIPNLESQPKEVQLICVDMSFNMGGPTLNQFQTSGKYIINKNYAAAASRLERSAWFGQVGNRSKNHVSVLRNLAKQQDQEKKGR